MATGGKAERGMAADAGGGASLEPPMATGGKAERGVATDAGGGASLEDVEEHLAHQDGPALSQDSATRAWSPATPTRHAFRDHSLDNASPQWSPHPTPRTTAPPLSSHPHNTPDYGINNSVEVTSTSWSNIPAAVAAEEEQRGT